MALDAAQSFLDALDDDPALVRRIDAVSASPSSVLAIVRNAGFDVTGEQVRDAFCERFGEQLDEEQLAAVAGGLTNDLAVGLTLFLAGHPSQAVAFSAAAAA